MLDSKVVNRIESLMLQMGSYMSIYEIGILLGIFFIFILCFTLGLLLRGRRFLPSFFFFLSFLAIIATPIALQLFMQNYLYTTKVTLTTMHPMEYTKGFFLSGKIENIGHMPINECNIFANVIREEKNALMPYINDLFPIASFNTTIQVDIPSGESGEFSVVVPNFSAKKPFFYSVKIDCYFSNNLINNFHRKPKAKKEDDKPLILESVLDSAELGEGGAKSSKIDSSEAGQDANAKNAESSDSQLNNADSSESSKAESK